MTTYSIVTTFSEKGFRLYGWRCLEDIMLRWPEDVTVHAFYEGPERPVFSPDKTGRVTWHSLDADPDRAKFLREAPPDHPTQYRLMGRRFCHKVFALTAAPRETDWLIWLDADTETFEPVTHDLLTNLCPEGVVASYLGRDHWEHSECGFVAYRIGSPFRVGRFFLDEFRRLYTSKELYWMAQHHDSWAFDQLRKAFERQGNVKFHNLSPNSTGLDVFEQSLLRSAIQHYKGLKAKRERYGDVA